MTNTRYNLMITLPLCLVIALVGYANDVPLIVLGLLSALVGTVVAVSARNR